MEALAQHYTAIKAAHIGLAMLSGGLFAGRGLGVLLGAGMPMAPWLRRTSMLIDSALLLAALALLAALQFAPLQLPWLHAKLGLLVAYIVLGTLALRRAPGRAAKGLAYAAALLCFAMMFSIARTHDPLGLLRPWLG